MSGYSDGEALWLTRLQAMDQFNGENSSRGKWAQRNSGSAAQYAVLKPGEQVIQKHGMGGKKNALNHTIIQLWQRYKEHGTSMTDLEALVQNVIDELDQYPTIGDAGDTVIQGNIIQVRELRETYSSPTAKLPKWLYVELVGEWNEEIDITYAE